MLSHIPTKAKDGVVLHQRPGVVVQTVVLVDQELADVSGRHVGGDLHHFSRPILAPHLHYLETGREWLKSGGRETLSGRLGGPTWLTFTSMTRRFVPSL